MTPGARVAAAIEVLDAVRGGDAAEKVLTTWARTHRFAGSGDRAVIRDHVYDALRRWRSSSVLGGGDDGRARMIGLLRGQGIDPATLFTGEGHAPEPLTVEEALAAPPSLSRAEALDVQDWLLPLIEESLGEACDATLAALRDRAPVFLRVNLARVARADAVAMLADEGIAAEPSDLAASALLVTGSARKIQQGRCFSEGIVELQDASSQAAIEAIVAQAPGAARILDYCAGGGGKALALADRTGAQVFAHDVDPGRMKDIPVRADRAGVRIRCLGSEEVDRAGPFDVVLADAPCSGSGAWRRQPEAKWRLTQERLAELTAMQDEILARIAGLVAPGGVLAYATCSLLRVENEARIEAFLKRQAGWSLGVQRRFLPVEGCDGFFVTTLTR